MENLIDRLGWKWLAAIMIACSVIFLILILTPLLNSQGKPVSSTNNSGSESNPIPTSAQEAFPPTQTPIVQPSYTNKFFSMQYPTAYSLTVGRIKEDGDAATLTGGRQNADIQVQVYDASETNLEKIGGFFSLLGYTKSPKTLSQRSATQYKGQLTLASKTFQETAVVAQNQGKIYKIQLKYESDKLDSAIEVDFLTVISTFKIL